MSFWKFQLKFVAYVEHRTFVCQQHHTKHYIHVFFFSNKLLDPSLHYDELLPKYHEWTFLRWILFVLDIPMVWKHTWVLTNTRANLVKNRTEVDEHKRIQEELVSLAEVMQSNTFVYCWHHTNDCILVFAFSNIDFCQTVHFGGALPCFTTKKKSCPCDTAQKRIFKPSVSSPCFSVENLFWATGWSHHITSWSAWFGDKCCWTCQKPAKTQRVRNECLQLHSRLEIRILDTWLRTKSKAMG